MSFIATSDVHGNLKNIDPFEQTMRKAFEECVRLNLPLFIGGDLNDTKSNLRSEFVGILCGLFYEFKDVKKYVLIGNHDLNNHHNHEDHSLEFMKSLPNTTVIDSPMVVMETWYAIPYRHTNEEILKEIQIARDMGAKRLLIHQGIMGASQSEYVIDESSITPEDLSGFDVVLTGHYHTHQTVGNATYFGSPFTVSFAEANQEKFIWHVEDEGEVKMNPIRTGCRQHVQLVWENTIPEKLFEPVPPNAIVKVVLKGSKEFCLGHTKDEIKKVLGVDNVSIVPEIVTTTKKRIEAHKVNKPLEVINDYLEQAETSLDKTELQKYLQGINNANTAS